MINLFRNLKHLSRTLMTVLPSKHQKSPITTTYGICLAALGLDLYLVFIPYMGFYNFDLCKISVIRNLTYISITSLKR